MFTASTGAFVNTSAFVIRKSSVLNGGPVVTTAFRNLVSGDGPDTPRGVDNYDPTSNEGYFIGPSDAVFGRLVMRRISDPGGTPAISANILITVSATSFPITVDHLGDTGGTNGNLDSLDDRLFVPQMRGGRLWTAHNIAVTAAGVGSNSNTQRRDAIRWYELNVPAGSGAPTVVQSGTIFDNASTVAAARQFWIPSVAISGQGHAAIGFSTAGTPNRVDAATNGRLSGDTLGTTGAVSIYTSSSTAYNPPSDPGPPRRWGDYSYTSVDPLDDMTMWTIQEFCNATNSYGVRVVKLLAPVPATPASASPSTVVAGQSSVNVTITGTAVSGSGFFDPGANLAAPALPFNHIGATVGGGVTVNSVTYTDPTHVTLNISTVGATPGSQIVTVTNPDGQSTASAAGILTVTVPAVTISGQITDAPVPGGLPLSGVTVSYSGTTSGTTTTDVGGNYTINVTSGGNYTVTPSGLGRKYTPSSSSFTNVTVNQTANFVGTPIGAGNLLISEFRLRGPSGANDEFAEIYNNSNTDITVSTADASAGFSLRASDGVVRFTIPNGTVIPARGHYLGTNSVAYSLSAYASGDATWTTDIPDNAGIALFRSSTSVLLVDRLDAVGSTSEANVLYKEGAGYPVLTPFSINYSFYRDLISGAPKDTDNNSADFLFVDTNGTSAGAGQRLGAPGPENLASPIGSNSLVASVIDPAVSQTLGPNRVRDLTSNPANNSTFGTLSIRRMFTNNSAANVTRLRFRVIDITTFPSPSGTADLRPITSSFSNVTITGGGSVPVQGLTLEQPPSQLNGGGFNSTLSAGTVTLGTPIAPGGSINVNFLMGVQQTGNFRFLVVVEALP